MPFQLLASHRYSGDAAQATSRTFFAENFHVIVPVVRGRAAPERTSSRVTMFTGVAGLAPCARRALTVGVRRSPGLVSAPVLATGLPAGRVISTVQWPHYD